MELNITKLVELSPSAALEEVHHMTVIPSAIILYLISGTIFLLIGLSVVKESRGKFFLIWITSMVLIFLLGVLPVMFMPDSVQWFADLFNIFG